MTMMAGFGLEVLSYSTDGEYELAVAPELNALPLLLDFESDG
jgi:hypothetical protein